MNFKSDKQLSKNRSKNRRAKRVARVKKSSTATTTTTTTTSNPSSPSVPAVTISNIQKPTPTTTEPLSIAEHARLERQKRQEIRTQTNAILTIQSFYRGRTISYHTKNLFRKQFDNKISDLSKVATLLLKAGKGVLRVPHNVLLPLLSQFLMFEEAALDARRLDLLCAYLISNLSDPSKNTATSIIEYGLNGSNATGSNSTARMTALRTLSRFLNCVLTRTLSSLYLTHLIQSISSNNSNTKTTISPRSLLFKLMYFEHIDLMKWNVSRTNAATIHQIYSIHGICTAISETLSCTNTKIFDDNNNGRTSATMQQCHVLFLPLLGLLNMYDRNPPTTPMTTMPLLHIHNSNNTNSMFSGWFSSSPSTSSASSMSTDGNIPPPDLYTIIIQILLYQPTFLDCCSAEMLKQLTEQDAAWHRTLMSCLYWMKHDADITTTILSSSNEKGRTSSTSNRKKNQKHKKYQSKEIYGWTPAAAMCANLIAMEERRRTFTRPSTQPPNTTPFTTTPSSSSSSTSVKIGEDLFSRQLFLTILSELLLLLPASALNLRSTVWFIAPNGNARHQKAVPVPQSISFWLRHGCIKERNVQQLIHWNLPKVMPDRSSIGVVGLDPALDNGNTTNNHNSSTNGGSGLWATVSSWGKKLLGNDNNNNNNSTTTEREGETKNNNTSSTATSSSTSSTTSTTSTSKKSKKSSSWNPFRRKSKKSRTEPSQSNTTTNNNNTTTTNNTNASSFPSIPITHFTSTPSVFVTCSFFARTLWLFPSHSSSNHQLLTHLSYSTQLVPYLWSFIENNFGSSTETLESYCLNEKKENIVTNQGTGICAVLTLFCMCYNQLLVVLDDTELYIEQIPLPRASVVRLISSLKILTFRLHWEYDSTDEAPSMLKGRTNTQTTKKTSGETKSNNQTPSTSTSTVAPFFVLLRNTTTMLLRNLYDRSSRRPIAHVHDPTAHSNLWLVPQLKTELGTGNRLVGLLLRGASSSTTIPMNEPYLDKLRRTKGIRAHNLLRTMPYSVSFEDRLLLFQYILKDERDRCQDQGDVNSAVKVRVRKSQIFEDTHRKLNQKGVLKKRIYVIFVNPLTGEDEKGIDAGGLFKELWTELSNVAFNPNYGLWNVTPVTNLMYPSSKASLIHSNSIELYHFLGRILGKAIFEQIVVQPNFTHFFLQKLLGKFSTLSDLRTLDEELYKNLMFLKTFEGDARDLMLSFSVTEDVLGVVNEINLIPNGSNIEVTSDNKLRYCYQMANYRLNVKIKKECDAFLLGLRDVVPVDWLRMFSERELQWLISGSDGPIDLADLKQNSVYVGGYTSMSSGIRRFWNVIQTFTTEEKRQLLRFVTSCERAPPLGFQALHPPFQIQWVGGAPNKLPSASTCFNILKLPSYGSDKVMKAKLLQSITSGAGFDLS